MRYQLLLLTTVFFLSSCINAPSPARILYNVGPTKDQSFDILLEIETQTYKIPNNDGYGDFRFDGTNICFWASYSDKERCIDYRFHHTDWAAGDSWEIKSYDGTSAVVTVKRIY